MNEWSSQKRYLRCRPGFNVRGQNICWAQWLLLFTFLALFLAGCGGGDEQDDGGLSMQQTIVAATVSAMSANPAPVAEPGTDAASAVQATRPPREETQKDPAAAADIPATEAALALQQTAEAEAAAAAAAQAERAATIEPIKAEVATYGVDPNQGDLGFTHPPISIEVTDFQDADYRNQNLFTVARDFVMAADVKWNSAYAESGCGFVVRNDGEEENPSQYIIGLTRGAEGHVLFAEQVKGDVDLNQVTDIYANGIDPKFEWQNDTTNRIAVVGRGQEFTLYSNGTRLGTVTGKAGFEEGFVAFIAVNRSGGIKCEYDNAWLWRMN